MTVLDRPREDAAPAERPPAHRAVTGTLLRWWRRLTAMRTAIVLLFLLALAAIPGSLLPQRSLSQNAVADYFTAHPTLAPLLDRLSLFSVFSSPWFAAVYLLLFVSLIGCVLPRALEHARALRADPPPVPRRLLRLPDATSLATTLDGPAALDVVEEELRVRRCKVVRRETAAGPELSAERGWLKETGNLVFHLSLVALLLGLAAGKLWGYSGNILLTEGQGYCNTFQQYDTYSAGPLVSGSDLTPLCVDLQRFDAQYAQNLTASSYTADITWGAAGATPHATTIGVNHPLRVDGDRLYVTGHGFTPEFTVTLANGTTFRQVGAPFLPSDTSTMASQGALKLPDLGPGRTDQLALEGFFAPTGSLQNGVLTSVDPRPLDPQVAIVAYEGYLGLDSGVPQSVYSVSQDEISRGQLKQVGAANLTEGQSTTLPDGTTITFSGLKQYAALQLSHDPGQPYVLGAAVALLLGLLGMLLLRRERFFARAEPAPDGGGTVLSFAALTRGSGESGPRFTALTGELRTALARSQDRVPAPRGHRTTPTGGSR